MATMGSVGLSTGASVSAFTYAQQPFEDWPQDDDKKMSDPYSMRGTIVGETAYASMANRTIQPRNILIRTSDLFVTKGNRDGDAPINKKHWQNQCDAIMREYEKTGTVSRHDLCCLLNFVDEANNAIQKFCLTETVDGIMDYVNYANRIEDLERQNQHKDEIIDSHDKERSAILKKLEKCAELAAYSLSLINDDSNAYIAISDWLCDNKFASLVPGTAAHTRRELDHAKAVEEIQEQRYKPNTEDSSHGTNDSIQESLIVAQIRQEEDQMPF